MTGSLPHPLEATLDRDLHLVDADPLIRRLHLRACGKNDAPLAVPGLAAICRAAMRFNTLIARAVRVADDDHDIELWAEAKPFEDGLRLVVRSWIEQPASSPVGALARAAARSGPEAASDRSVTRMQLDSGLRIIGHADAEHLFGDDQPTGQSLTAIFRFEDHSHGDATGMIEAIAERQPFDDQPVTVRATGLPLLLSGKPLFDGIDRFAGYLCELSSAHGVDPAPAHSRSQKTEPLVGPVLNRDLMTALRQPVGRILANAETISGKLRGSLREAYAHYAGDIVEAAEHLRALIDDMSDLEAIERPGFSPEPDAIDLADVGRRAAGLLAVKASDHQMIIDAPADHEAMPATGEFRRVLQILVNLLTNAIRYSPDGSTIKITVDRDDGRAQVRVIDQGPGIADEDRERVFEKFERLGRHGDGGSGLGLYISRRIAVALGGSLSIEPRSDQGAVFLLELPARD